MPFLRGMVALTSNISATDDHIHMGFSSLSLERKN